jgi:CSLREA domain-containing protein
VITVTSLADNLVHDHKVTLREAIQAANTNTRVDGSAKGQPGVEDTIVFQSGLTGTIKLDPALGELLITGSVNIVGLGAKNTVIDAQHNSRVFEVAASAGNVELDALTITGGTTTANLASGGGILFESPGTLTLKNDAVTGNALTGTSARGAGIFTNTGALTVLSSTISGNTTTGDGGDGGGIFSENGAVTLSNSTLAGNSVSGYHADGAGLYTDGTGAGVTLTNSTVSANVDTGGNATGGAVSVVRGSIVLANSIVSGNTISSGSAPDVGFGNYHGSATFSASHSLIGVNNGTPLAPAPVGSPDANGNFVGTFGSPVDARLGPLDDNGGQTQTMALLLGSPAINAGDNALALAPDGTPLKTDQRGAGFPRIVGGTVDMGAYESNG